METKNLNSKWWYRLVKVIYIFSFLLSLGIPTAVVLNNVPYVDEYSSRYYYKCDDGSEWGKTAEINGYDLNNAKDDFSIAGEPLKNGAQARCAKTNLTKEELLDAIKLGEIKAGGQKNYTILVHKEIFYGSWMVAILGGIGALIATIIFFVITRAIFLYVVFNKSFWKSLIFKRAI